jgi:DNA-binding transcriptional LysR family regulator
MELNHLKYFYVVAKCGGFSKASKTLRVAQPAISKMVKNLEEGLNIKLLERVGRNVRLTKIGNDVFRKCELIFGHVEELQDIVRPKATKIGGPLNLCATDVVASHLLPDVLNNLLSSHNSIYPQLITSTASESLQLLIAKKSEVALLFHTPEIPSGLEIRNSFPVRFYLVVASHLKRSKVVCSSFIGSREIDDVANKTYPALNKLRKKFPDAQIRLSANALSAHHRMVQKGMGVAILPDFLVSNDIANGTLSCLLSNESFIFNLKLIARSGEPLSNPMAAFIDQLKKSFDPQIKSQSQIQHL